MMGIILTLLLLFSAGAASNTKLQCVGFDKLFDDRVIDTSKHLIERKDLRVVTFNSKDLFVYRPLPGKKEFIQENPAANANPPKPEAAVQGIIDAFKDIKPDILVLQEVIGTHSSHILDARHEYVHITSTPKDARGTHTAFLIRADLNVDVQLVVPTLNPAHAKLHRGLPYIKIRQKDVNGKVDRSTPPDLIVLGVHLQAYRTGQNPEHFSKLKTEEIQQVIKVVRELEEKYPDTRIMVAGDFNADINIRPEMIALKSVMQDSLDFSTNSKDRGGRTTQTFHAGSLTEAAQLDAVFMNVASLQHLVTSYIYRYRDSKGREKQYTDSVGNKVNYPTSYELRDLNPSDHNPVVTVLDMTTTTRKQMNSIPKYQQTLRSLYRELSAAKPGWGMNDTLSFKVDLQGETMLFLRWLETNKMDSYLHVITVEGNTVYLQTTIAGVGYLFLKDSENSASWIRNVHFQALPITASAAVGL